MESFRSAVSFIQRPNNQVRKDIASTTVLAIGLGGWFTDPNKEEEERIAKGNIGGVAGIMDSMDNFKASQRAGKLTAGFVRELSAMTIEGGENGKVKVFLDGQQRPIRVEIDEGFFEQSDAGDVAAAVTSAMKEAHDKSIERMDDKLKGFYNQLGFK